MEMMKTDGSWKGKTDMNRERFMLPFRVKYCVRIVMIIAEMRHD